MNGWIKEDGKWMVHNWWIEWMELGPVEQILECMGRKINVQVNLINYFKN